VKYLEDVPDQEIVDLNIPTGVPLVEELDENLKSVRHYYLGDPAQIEQAVNKAKSTGGASR
jgi:2,3-bisphosphoglycerate-dependent phosphoglycerate mutase